MEISDCQWLKKTLLNLESIIKEGSCLVWGVISLGFSGGSVIKNLPGNAGDVGSIPGSGRSLEKFLGGKSHGLRSLACCSSWGHKESDTTEWTELNWTEQLNNNIMSSDSRLDGMPCVLRDEGPTGEWKQGGRCCWKERAWNVLVVKRNACVGVWEGIRGNEHCQVDLYFNYQSIPRTFFQDAGIREMASFNSMFVHYKYKD